MLTSCFPLQMIESPVFQPKNGTTGSTQFPMCNFIYALFFIVDSSCFLSQIVDHSKIFQLPEAMKVVDALVRSAQQLLFDASSDMDVDKVRKCVDHTEI